MLKRLTIVICIIFFHISYSNICTPHVNKNKPKGISGGQFSDCALSYAGDSCAPKVGEQNYMSRHHIFDKHAWIDVLEKGLNHGGVAANEAKERIISMLEKAGASEAVISDLENVGQDCKSGTDKWLTWLPVNLSLGPAPQDRSFDPNNNFDRWALLIVPEEYQDVFSNIRQAMDRGDGIAVASSLAELPAVEDPWPMTLGEGSNWVRAYDDVGKEKYCPSIIFDQYRMGRCPNSEISHTYNSFLQAA
ncbi:hypothetical protein LO80_07585 [Candidatus Francisella endociliophora]|uniref:Uncharacterized protein n=1 Tax=Candidatus Francisella endociliophora TaxID=653937 RepID=A0A097EQK0_9GAMM|nr:hypothetical protein [Francisella sp. FSC1006]AIT09845.1 hypothetical protein LO80_07585 [Francisella sp. FSC1006]